MKEPSTVSGRGLLLFRAKPACGRREPSVAILIALSQEFEVSLDYLLSGRPDTARDVSALHRLVTEECSGTGSDLSKEQIVCHLLWALLE